MNIGDLVTWDGKLGRIINYSGTGYIVYITDGTGGYNIELSQSEVSGYSIVEQSETAAKPTRYNKDGATLEVWDAIRMLNLDYMQGNILKYSYRYKDKNGPEDLLKAINYCIKLIANETKIDYYELHKLTPEELAKRIKK